MRNSVDYFIPESVKLDCSKVLETCMKSIVSSILTNLIFYTHLVQIQTPKFLLKNSIYQSFSVILPIELHGFRIDIRQKRGENTALCREKHYAELM